MNGELLPVWLRSWQEVWLRLARSKAASSDLFVELVRGLAPPPQQPASPPTPPFEAFDASGQLVDLEAVRARREYQEAIAKYSEYRNVYETALSSERQAKIFFRGLVGGVTTEADAVRFLESAYATLATFGNQALAIRFRSLVNEFVTGFSLRYEVRGHFSLHATIPGVFSKLMSEVRRMADADTHLSSLLSEFEEAFADLKVSRTQARIKTCLQKQFNLLEALGRKCPNVTETTLGAMCNQLDWPHATIKDVGKKLYGFGSNYPGVRHAGDPSSALRHLDMRDLVSLSLMLASFTPYVAYGLDSDLCYSA
jgi:hypothetical protein